MQNPRSLLCVLIQDTERKIGAYRVAFSVAYFSVVGSVSEIGVMRGK